MNTTPSPLAQDGAAHTVAEITQQPRLWREVGRNIEEGREALDAFLRPLLARPDLRIVLTGAGTSAFAGRIARAALAGATGRRVDAVATTDIVADPDGSLDADVPTLLVSFARSGDSPESVAATEFAEARLTDVSHLVITCNAAGRLAREHGGRDTSHVLLMPDGSNDQGFAMTSSFTCMVLAALLAFRAADAPAALPALAAAADHLTSGGADARVDALLDGRPERLVYLGSGALKGLAEESALKLLELTGGAVLAMAETALGFRHGPKAVLDDRTAVVVYISNDPYTRAYDLDILAELRAALPAGTVVAIAGRQDGLPDSDDTWLLPGLADAPDAALALPAVVCAQLIALRSSLARGLRPDNPFPSGEVNRVVQGVTVHELPERGDRA
ncbi:SIS domain-containing protein [Streptomyces sp. 3MP-14]|uniref:SIS domain-containing protein n=1 Tax=Streptomyces mimosae TaxID=2586635 RepID=A0A5N5ZLR5_9ACTN|nr:MULTISPECIES: SIS domain-containing protein [Streptomyces]KAB8157437.1 SIS domain-containing protein [Streptomyces mimosae]KAB8172261.1 SIS domain-containing protein [Streptomyces sp. 3MP-14]